MADISRIKIKTTTYDIKDGRIPTLTNTQDKYLRGDGTWAIPSFDSKIGAEFTDKDTYLLVTLH